jgi:hypothetical protein
MKQRQRRPKTAAVLAFAALAGAALAGCSDATARTAPSATSPPPEPSASPTSGVLTLSDTGIGGLSLGLPKEQAVATGLVGGKRADLSSEQCEVRRGRDGVQFVYFEDGKVSIIAVGRTIRLSTDLGVGDTYTQLHAIYPDAAEDVGKLLVKAPEAAVKAHYRIGIDDDRPFPDSTITEIALQADDQSCYE